VTQLVLTPEEEAKAAVLGQYEMLVMQRDEYDWEPKVLDVGDYLALFVRIHQALGTLVPHASAL